MTFISRLTTALATGAVLLNTVAPLALADSITVSGNGTNSDNQVNLTVANTNTVDQNNKADITNHVDSNASTGNNSASHNTDGDSTITTGNATSTTNVTNAANLNQADTNCGCTNGNTTVTVAGNGDKSENTASIDNANIVSVNQTNNADFHNDVDAHASTGKNELSHNTGGDASITTGNATNNVTVNNAANANVAIVGGNSDNAGSTSITIEGNGVHSDNKVDLDNGSIVELDQTNSANIKNDVDADATTGGNKVKSNTGGSTSIDTGDASTETTVNNLANFNAADISCDCTLSNLDVTVKKNGDGSKNKVDATATNSVFPDQLNTDGTWNGVDGKAKTGANSVEFSTGSMNGDPSVSTGDSSSTNDVNNVGNVNTLGNVTTVGGIDLGMTFDLNGLLNSLTTLFS